MADPILAVPDDVDLDALTLLPHETVCRFDGKTGCGLAYHRPLGACPTCKELR